MNDRDAERAAQLVSSLNSPPPSPPPTPARVALPLIRIECAVVAAATAVSTRVALPDNTAAVALLDTKERRELV